MNKRPEYIVLSLKTVLRGDNSYRLNDVDVLIIRFCRLRIFVKQLFHYKTSKAKSIIITKVHQIKMIN